MADVTTQNLFDNAAALFDGLTTDPLPGAIELLLSNRPGFHRGLSETDGSCVHHHLDSFHRIAREAVKVHQGLTDDFVRDVRK